MNAADAAFLDFDRRRSEMLSGMPRRKICSAKSPLHFLAATGGHSIRRKNYKLNLLRKSEAHLLLISIGRSI
jgi:hypothetical protein